MARTRGCFLNGEKITCCWDKWPRFVIAAFFPAFPSTGCLRGKYLRSRPQRECWPDKAQFSVSLRPRISPCEVLCVLCFGWTRFYTAVCDESTLGKSLVSIYVFY